MVEKIEMSWYLGANVVEMARELLGKVLCTKINGKVTKGMIVETEAYSGDHDKACHANGQKMTKRNEIMFAHGGHAYVYLCYGIHHLFNVVTNREGKADAVLVRALQPLEGVDIMLERRKMQQIEKRLTAGPGVLTEAMGIRRHHNKARLDSEIIWIEEGAGLHKEIVTTTRVGVEYAEEDALKPWRFYIRDNKWVSKF